MAIGEETNNVAEYCGLRICMERAVVAGDSHVVFEVDSDVVAKHMAKRDGYTCGSTDLRPYYEDCWKLGKKLTAKNMGILHGKFATSTASTIKRRMGWRT